MEPTLESELTPSQREMVAFAVLEKLARMGDYINTVFESDAPTVRDWAKRLLKQSEQKQALESPRSDSDAKTWGGA